MITIKKRTRDAWMATKKSALTGLTLTGFAIGGLSFSNNVEAGWELEWIDKFDGTGVNWNNWTAHIQANFNNEIQCYTDDDSSENRNYDVSDGTLKITARRQDVNCVGLNNQARSWTSGRLVSKDKREFLYGRLEARVRFDTLDGGTWPAFWALENRIAEDPIKGDNDIVHWPNPGAGEIDIWEWFSNQGDSYIINFFNANNCGAEYRHPYAGGAQDVLDFHTYAMEWSPQEIRFLMDNQVVKTFNVSACPQYKEPMYVLINLAIGGNLGGAVDPALQQATLEVDYIAHCTASDDSEFAMCNEQTPVATDSDNDGVSDNLDKCADTAEGTNVDIDGCEEVVSVQSPDELAPAPQHDAGNVISLFSDAYNNIATIDYAPNWGQSTQSSIITLEQEQVLRYQGLNYQGTSFEQNPQDLSEMEFLRFDYWSANTNSFEFYLISPGPVEDGYTVDVKKHQWQSLEVPLSAFPNVDLSDVFQLKVVGSGTLFLDNIYFHNERLIDTECCDDQNGDDQDNSEQPIAENVAPSVSLFVTQGGRVTQNISRDAGRVVITAQITDDNSSDQHSVAWQTNFDTMAEATTYTLEFDPEKLAGGNYSVIATVSDDGAPVMSGDASFDFDIGEAPSSSGSSFVSSHGAIVYLLLSGLLALRRCSAVLRRAKISCLESYKTDT